MVKNKTRSKTQRSNEHRSIKDWPESERPREKLLQLGPEGLSDGELLAVLIRIGATGQSAEDLARQLMAQFNGINGIDRAHIEELLAVPGMGVAKTAQVKAAIEIGKRVRRQTSLPQSFDHAAEVAAYVRPHFEGKRQECFLTILLDGQNQLLAERWIAEGIPTQATVYVRRIMEEALRVSASAFVVAHNHNRMYEALRSSDIIICDLTGQRPNVFVEAGFALKHHEKNRLIFLFEPRNRNDKVPFDLTTFKYVPISQAAEIPNKVKAEIIAILRDAGAPI